MWFKHHLWQGGQRSDCLLPVYNHPAGSHTSTGVNSGKAHLEKSAVTQWPIYFNTRTKISKTWPSSALLIRTPGSAAPTSLGFIKYKVTAASCHFLRAKVKLTMLPLAPPLPRRAPAACRRRWHRVMRRRGRRGCRGVEARPACQWHDWLQRATLKGLLLEIKTPACQP